MVPVAVIDADSPAASFTGVFIHIVLAGTDSFTVLGELAPRAGASSAAAQHGQQRDGDEVVTPDSVHGAALNHRIDRAALTSWGALR